MGGRDTYASPLIPNGVVGFKYENSFRCISMNLHSTVHCILFTNPTGRPSSQQEARPNLEMRHSPLPVAVFDAKDDGRVVPTMGLAPRRPPPTDQSEVWVRREKGTYI